MSNVTQYCATRYGRVVELRPNEEHSESNENEEEYQDLDQADTDGTFEPDTCKLHFINI